MKEKRETSNSNTDLSGVTFRNQTLQGSLERRCNLY